MFVNPTTVVTGCNLDCQFDLQNTVLSWLCLKIMG